MRSTKKLLAIMVTAATMASQAMPVMAAEWKQDNTGWWYQEDNGSYPTSSWKWIDGNHDGVAECYYFNQAGYMLANTKTPDGYQVNADGVWVVNGTVQTKTTGTSDQTNTQADSKYTDDYSGTYVDTWSDGSVVTQVLVYNPSDKTLTDTTYYPNGTSDVSKFTYYGPAFNGKILFELVSTDEKDALFFSAPGVMEGASGSIHRQ